MKKVIIYTLIVVISLWLFITNGYCIGNIQVPFDPDETYPIGLKDMHLQTEIVANGIAKAIIVVDMANFDYLTLANNINTKINEIIPGVTLPIIDDDAFLANPQFNNTIILIGHYATNKVIKQYVYEKKRQHVDINRPGSSNWVISNVRIGQEINGEYYLANAVVIASQSLTQLQSAVNLFTNTMLPAVLQGSNIIFDESQGTVGKHSTRWSITPNYQAPDPTLPSTTSTNLGDAVTYANKYWITGDKNDLEYFVKIMNNYGSAVENPNNFPPYGNINNVLGDNTGAIDFHMQALIPAWMNLERSPYFSDSNLSLLDPIQNMNQRLYITKLLNYMIREYYKCGNVRGLISGGTGNPQVRGAIGYAERDNFPLGNHELGAALGLFVTGQYFTRDGYSYDATNVQNYSYNPTYPDDHAAQWVIDGDIAFDPYLQLSYLNDDGGGYWQSDTNMTRDYLRFKDDSVLSEVYLGNSGGSLGIGMDRSVADTFCIIAPNSLMKPGFGDVHEIDNVDFEPYQFRFWREQYLDGRYSWMCDDLYNTGTLGGSDWGKSFLQYGLVDLEDLGIQNEKPVDLLGLKIIPLQENLYNVANNMGGQYTYGNAIYDEPMKEAHVGLNEAINKVILKSGWGNGFDEEDQYIGIDCTSYFGHGHEDALGIFAFEDNDSMFIIDNTYGSETRGYQNALTVKKTDHSPTSEQQAESNSSTVARVNDSADFTDTGFVHLELPKYGNFLQWSVEPVSGEWSVDLHRTLFWKKEGLLLVLDEAQANDAGAYELALRWKPNTYTSGYSYTLNGDTIDIVKTAQAKHCIVKTVGGNYIIDPTYGNARTISNHILGIGDTASVPTLIYTYTGSNDPNYQITTLNNDTIYHITSSDPNEHIYLGKALNTQTKTFANFNVEANMFYIDTNTSLPDYFALVNGYSLSQNPNIQLFTSDIPISIEFDLVELNGIIDIAQGQGLATIGLYNPQNYPLYVDNLPAQNSGWLNGVTTFNLETEEGEDSQHQFYFDDSGIPFNQPPEIDPIPPTTVPAKQTAVVNVSATDPEGDPMTLSIDTTATKITFIDNGNGTGIFTMETNPNMIGNQYIITLTATDSYGASSTAPIIINVVSGKTGPYLPTGAMK